MTQAPRLMTVMFADVTGSARLYERLSDDEATHALDRCIKRISRCIEVGNGRTLQINGDELLAVFDSAENACLAAIDMQTRIADLPPVSGVKLGIRVGLHAGLTIESPGTLTGTAVTTTARIAGLASRDHIVLSETLLNSLPVHLRASTTPLPGLGRVIEEQKRFNIYELAWLRPAEHEAPLPERQTQRLFIHYHGKPFILDAKSPPLTLGRDLDSHVLIEDRKASRKHARIEARPDGFFYIDTSTNGSFVTLGRHTESLLRHDELLLLGEGRICFGSSSNDPKSDFFTFEHR